MGCFNFGSAQTVDLFRIKLSPKFEPLTALLGKIIIVHKLSSERPLKNRIILLTCLSESQIVILNLFYVFAICLLILCCSILIAIEDTAAGDFCLNMDKHHKNPVVKRHFSRSFGATKDTQV